MISTIPSGRRAFAAPRAKKSSWVMRFTDFEHQFLPRVLIPLLGGLFVICALHQAAHAEPNPGGGAGFIVSAADGYGVNECIKSGEDCAKIVADAWCEAHGHGASRAYGRAGDVTGSIDKVAAKAPSKAVSEDDVYISCGE
jgi:hypothetical protein